MGARNYSEATRKALFALSLGRCFEPNCPERVVRMSEDGVPVVLVQIAHIHPAKKGGPRGNADPSLSVEFRRSFANLLLLCTYHHKLVDNMPTGDHYSVEQLNAWKAGREGKLVDHLQMVTDERLAEILGSSLSSVITETKTQLLAAIGGVETVSQDNARLLRTLVDETFNRPHLDPDAVAALAESAHALRGVAEYAPMLSASSTALSSTLPDYAPMLARSSSTLVNLPDWVVMLRDAARDLSHLRDHVPALERASRQLVNLPDYTTMLDHSAKAIVDVPFRAQSLSSAADNANSAALAAADTIRQAIREIDDLRQSGIATELQESAAIIVLAAQQIHSAAATAAEGQKPDRFTWFLRGALTCLVLVGVLALVVWYKVPQ